MRLRMELVELVIPEDVLKQALENQHRYSSAPVFSIIGVGHLSPTSTEDSARELEQITELQGKIISRLRKSGNGEEMNE